MRPRRTVHLLVGIIAVATSGVVGIAAAPASAVTSTPLYATPLGSGDTCTSVDPCAIGTAFAHSADEQPILLASGTYGTVSGGAVVSPLTDTLAETAVGVHISGVPGAAAPVIESDAVNGVNLNGANSTINGVDIDYTGVDSGLVLFAATTSATHVSVRASVGNACVVLGTLTDSLCVATGPNSAGVSGTYTGSVLTPTLRGVTAEAPGAGSYGIEYTAGADQAMTVSATNVIAHGGLVDVDANISDSTGTTTITLSHCDFHTTRSTAVTGTASSTAPGTATVIEGAGNIAAAPKFSGSGYREAAGSPTIDAGAKDPAADTDLGGLPRTIGKAPDIGAYERPAAPTLGAIKTKLRKKSATLTGAINPNGLATSVRFRAGSGKASVTSTKRAGSGARPVTISETIAGLAPKTTYTVKVSATNSVGTVKKTVTFTTK